MNTLIISTFSCTFEKFKDDVTNLFIEGMCKEFVTDYEFVKVNEHKSHLLMKYLLQKKEASYPELR